MVSMYSKSNEFSRSLFQVKVLYVRNLKSDFNEEKIKELFEPFGAILRIKKLKDYAFVHFEEREHAVNVCIFFFCFRIISSTGLRYDKCM